MLPIIAIVGRPNVGKSTLFNRLTRTRAALVADQPGVTRDRQYGLGSYGDSRFVLVDTGGLPGNEPEDRQLTESVTGQSLRAMDEADVVLWLVDGRSGLTAADQQLAAQFRPLNSKVHLVVNKIESLDAETARAEFFSLGFGDPVPISAEHGQGIAALMESILAVLPGTITAEPDPDHGVRVCVIGRPNAGKSTLINRMLGEERMVTSAAPGTTRDSITIPFERRGRQYLLVDTAGVRRRARVRDHVEKISVLKSLQSVNECDVVIAVIDSREGIAEQDLSLLGFTADSGKSLIIALNKWDDLPADQKDSMRRDVDRKLRFVDYASVHRISALHGTGVGTLFETIDAIHASRNAGKKSASEMSRLLADAVDAHPPPLVRGRRIKLRYAHIGGNDPLRIIVHGNQTQSVPESYRRYLANTFRERLQLVATPVVVEFKYGENPYKGRRNELTGRQLRKRARLIRRRGGN